MTQPIFNLNDPTQFQGVTESPPIPNDPGTIQNTLIARLKAMQGSVIASNLEVMAFPDDPENWRPVNQVGTILVRWEGFEAGDVEDVGLVVQEIKHRYKIGVLARGLGWPDAAGVSPTGAYAILQSVLVALLGYKVPGCRKTYAAKADFVRRDRQGGIWIYALEVIVPTVIIETPDAYTPPTLTLVTKNEVVGESVESVSTEDQP